MEKRHAPRPRRIVITGAASGIGQATGELYAAQGDEVVGIDRVAGTELPFPVVQADLAVAEPVSQAVTRVADMLGGIDVLVCSAGMTARGTVETTPVEIWDRIFAVNVRSAFLCAKAAMPYLLLGYAPAIVNVVSQFALAATENYVAYCASKAALLHLTKTMALDHGRAGVRINAVCPGPTDTPMLRNDLEAGGSAAVGARRAVERTLTNRAVAPCEIAEAIAFLASDKSASTMGAALIVDAGFSL